MKEVKFKVFHKFLGKMLIPERLYIEDGVVTAFGIDLDDRVFQVKAGIGLELMQYTGLKDKNGKEIYEGDILQKDNLFIKVEFRNGCFMGIKTKNYGNCEDVLNKYILNEFEIVGNIYENPELI